MYTEVYVVYLDPGENIIDLIFTDRDLAIIYLRKRDCEDMKIETADVWVDQYALIFIKKFYLYNYVPNKKDDIRRVALSKLTNEEKEVLGLED